MALPALAFVVVNCTLVRLPFLLDLWLEPALLALMALLGAAALSVRSLRFCGVLFLSVVFSGWWTTLALNLEIGQRVNASTPLEVSVTGQIEGLPANSDGVARFHLRVLEGEYTGRRFRVSWYQPLVPPQADAVCLLHLKLRPPRGSVNPGVFDYERWLFAGRVHGLGSVRDKHSNNCRPAESVSVGRFRAGLRTQLIAASPRDQSGTFQALALGDTGGLSPDEWQALNNTGTTHLLIVSGLHVGFAAALAYGLLRFLGAGLASSALATLVFTGGYALLAGWGLPVQRAFVMLSVVLLVKLLRRPLPWLMQWWLALVCVLALDPLASLSHGFWLSFGAVLALLMGLQGYRSFSAMGLWRTGHQLLRTQWIAFIGLLPILAVMLGQLPLASLMTNLIAIPWVGFLVVPLLLIALLVLPLSFTLGQQLLLLDGFLIHCLWRLLHAHEQLPLVMPVASLSFIGAGFVVLGCCLLLLPQARHCRWLGLLLLSGFMLKPVQHADQLKITFLDVGQGLAVFFHSQQQALLYDTGPSFGTRYSAAKQIVLPYLRQQGVHHLDRLVISHGDNDHAGGRDAVLEALTVTRQIDEHACDDRWQVDGFSWRSFAVASNADSRNDRSCLLLVESPGFRLLLTGDIEMTGELALASLNLGQFDLMSVPHHGSRSSSAPWLLNRLMPGRAVVSASFGNRFGHPDTEVIRRYRNRSISVFNTGHQGAVTVMVNRSGSTASVTVSSARETMPALWRSPTLENP